MDNIARKKERRNATHVKRHARKHKPKPYIPHIYSSIGSDHREIHDEKKKSTKAQKVWGGHGQRGNNEKANKRSPPTTGKQRYGEQG